MFFFIMSCNGLAMKRGKTTVCFFVPGQKSSEWKAHVSTEYGLPCFMSRCYSMFTQFLF
jgi:hypothetical protein